jgi:HSP20 family protein
MFESLMNSPVSLFAELDRLQREMQQAFGGVGRPGNIRAMASGSFPAINIGSTPAAIEIYAFAPGIDPSKLDVQVDRGILTLAGERSNAEAQGGADAKGSGQQQVSVYARERFSGRFKRTISLSDDVDPNKVTARYRDGVLHVTVGRRESTQPKRIVIQ